MGGGNGQKAKMARSQLDSNKKAMSIQCKVCMQTFMCTTSEVKCREHAEAKHPKSDVYLISALGNKVETMFSRLENLDYTALIAINIYAFKYLAIFPPSHFPHNLIIILITGKSIQ
ncbi:hypothetical protein Ahy_B05g079655 [Arachis hypogaea]|uniref:At2g23090-like zinc-binding domain-containing protein n=1 Tax=Arachis hypogaea TaxID=3818 RepID=A0A444ZAP1_ARAHY|nr:hypothetical protein Ahy_B05g079655 [Arachis hypogaea]